MKRQCNFPESAVFFRRNATIFVFCASIQVTGTCVAWFDKQLPRHAVHPGMC